MSPASTSASTSRSTARQATNTHPALHEIQGEQPRARDQLSSDRLSAALGHRVPQHRSVVSKEKGPKNGLPPTVAVPKLFPPTAAATWAASTNPFLSGDPNVSGLQSPRLDAAGRCGLAAASAIAISCSSRWTQVQAIDSIGRFRRHGHLLPARLRPDEVARRKKAFDIESEPAQLREKYGRTPVGKAACWPAVWSRPVSACHRRQRLAQLTIHTAITSTS